MSQSDPKAPKSMIDARHAKLPSHWLVLVVVGLLALHAALGLWAASTKSLTFDEPTHLTAGMSYWTYDDYRLHPENGVLPQRLESLPARMAVPQSFPGPDAHGWDTANVFLIGRQWFRALGPRTQGIIMSARCANMLLSVALGLTVFLWSRSLFGDRGGLVSLTLYAFCPTMLAHGPMITSDIASGLFFMLSCAALWALLHRVSPMRTVLLGLAAGGMGASKFSAPLVVVIAVILLLVRWLAGPSFLGVSWWKSASFKVKANSALIPAIVVPSFVVSGLIGLALVWAFLGFRFAQTVPTLPELRARQVSWEEMTESTDVATKLVLFAREHRIFPDAYLYGQLFVLNGAKSRSCFWDGDYSVYGWPLFFPYAFVVKTPLATLGVISLSGIAWARYCLARGKGRKRDPSLLWVYRVSPLLALICVYACAAIFSHINIGHRHILPIYPALYVLGGGAGWWFSRASRWPAALVAGLLLLLAIEAVCVWPNYLSYFNQVVGGSANGYKHLVDSSLDWGQDLPSLKKWLDAQGLQNVSEASLRSLPLPAQTPVYLSFFGTDSPDRFGIRARTLPSIPDLRVPGGIPEPFEAGVYCISATMLQSVYSPFPGHWTSAHEEAYQGSLKNIERLIAAPVGSPERAKRIAEGGEEYWSGEFIKFESIRFARLASYLRHREPDAMINNTILVYRLSDKDIHDALFEKPRELEPIQDP